MKIFNRLFSTLFEIFMKAIGRLYQYFDYKHIKPTRFEKDNGLSNGYFGVQLKRDADIGSSILEIIINNCRDLNIEWLISGNGSMLNRFVSDLSCQNIVEEPNPNYNSPTCENCKMKDILIESLQREIDTQGRFIKHLEEKKSPDEDVQKRNEPSAGCGNNK